MKCASTEEDRENVTEVITNGENVTEETKNREYVTDVMMNGEIDYGREEIEPDLATEDEYWDLWERVKDDAVETVSKNE